MKLHFEGELVNLLISYYCPSISLFASLGCGAFVLRKRVSLFGEKGLPWYFVILGLPQDLQAFVMLCKVDAPNLALRSHWRLQGSGW